MEKAFVAEALSAIMVYVVQLQVNEAVTVIACVGKLIEHAISYSEEKISLQIFPTGRILLERIVRRF